MHLCRRAPFASLFRYAEQRAELLAAPGNHQAIDEVFQKKYEAIPLVELGEYGHDHDPAQVEKLRRETAELHRQFAAKVLKQDLVLQAKTITREAAVWEKG